jgi:hypothetical protein
MDYIKHNSSLFLCLNFISSVIGKEGDETQGCPCIQGRSFFLHLGPHFFYTESICTVAGETHIRTLSFPLILYSEVL